MSTKEQQLDLFADWTSAATMRANQLRLYLSATACMLMHALRRLGLKQTPWLAVSDDPLETPEDRCPGSPHGPQRLDLHVGSLSLQRDLRCHRSELPGHSSALLRTVLIKCPKKRNRSIAQAELCLHTALHVFPHHRMTRPGPGRHRDSQKNVPACLNYLDFRIGEPCGLRCRTTGAGIVKLTGFRGTKPPYRIF